MSDGPIIVTSLELTDPAAIVSPARPAPGNLGIDRVADPVVNERLYREIGAPLRWTDRLGWTVQGWAQHAAGVETWVASVDGAQVGYHELRVVHASAEIAIFGLLEGVRGLGLGGHLLTHALRRGLELAPRVWVHTCTDDGPHALGNYRARGLSVFDVRPA